MEIKYSPQALRDLDGIWDDIVRVSVGYDTADIYISNIRDAVKGKREFPKSGTPLYYGNFFPGFWSVSYKKYRAFYRLHNHYLQVVRVLPVRSSYMQILFKENQDE